MQKDPKAEENREKGNEAFRSKHFNKALEFYQEALKFDPENPIIFSNICAAYVNLSKMDDALAAIRKAIVLSTVNSSTPSPRTLAKLLMRKSTILRYFKNTKAAKACLEAALKCENLDPNLQRRIKRLIKEVQHLIEKRNKQVAAGLEKRAPDERVCPHFDFYDDDEEYFDEDESGFDIADIMAQYNSNLFGPKKDDSKAKAAEKRYKENLPFVEKYLHGKSFIIKIRMQYLIPEIYRIVKVPSNMKLDVFHDKVISPVMGWLRNYHAFFFQPLPAPLVPQNQRHKVGLAYGPIHSQSVDMCHVGMHGMTMEDAAKKTLAQMLQNVGDRLLYIYDLGDMFRHEIILQKIETTDVEAVKLLEGANACPPENFKGNYNYSKDLEVLDEGEKNYKKPSRKYKELFADCQNSMNYSGSRMQFVAFAPYDFDLKLHQQMLDRAMKSKDSPYDMSNMHTIFDPLGQMKKMGMDMPKPGQGGQFQFPGMFL